jgi:hypothetical protein
MGNSAQRLEEFLQQQEIDNDRVDFRLIYADMADDLVAGILLSQIVYWHLPGKNGQSRLRVVREGATWLAKAYGDWFDECRISEKQARRAMAVLEQRGIVETALFKFAGAPTTHIRIVPEGFMARWLDCAQRYKSILPKGTNGLCPKVQIHSTQRDESSTETTTETTPETTTKDMPDAGASGTPQAEEDLSPSRAMFTALAGVCQIDARIATVGQRGELNQTERMLRKVGVTPGQLVGFPDWWSAHDWRGQKGQPPRPSQVRETWAQYRAFVTERERRKLPGGAVIMPSSRGQP